MAEVVTRVHCYAKKPVATRMFQDVDMEEEDSCSHIVRVEQPVEASPGFLSVPTNGFSAVEGLVVCNADSTRTMEVTHDRASPGQPTTVTIPPGRFYKTPDVTPGQPIKLSGVGGTANCVACMWGH